MQSEPSRSRIVSIKNNFERPGNSDQRMTNHSHRGPMMKHATHLLVQRWYRVRCIFRCGQYGDLFDLTMCVCYKGFVLFQKNFCGVGIAIELSPKEEGITFYFPVPSLSSDLAKYGCGLLTVSWIWISSWAPPLGTLLPFFLDLMNLSHVTLV